MNKQTIAVIGANSMVGSRFCELSENDFNLIKTDIKGSVKIDITDQKSVNFFFNNHNFDYLVLFSAYTDVDEAEKQRNNKNSLSWKINVNGTKNIVDDCLKYGKKLIFISTDFVFNGKNGPYAETDKAGEDLPKISWYGITKLEAEKLVMKSLENSIVLRISYPYRSSYKYKSDIVKRLLKLYEDDKLYPMFVDQYFTPTFIDDIYSAIKLLINKNEKGIFHLASPIITTQFEFSNYILNKFTRAKTKIQKGYLAKLLKSKNITPRPLFGGLKVDKLTNLGFLPTTWKEGIDIIFKQSNGKLL